MSRFRNQRMSRRSAITGMLGTAALLRTGAVGSVQVDRPAPVDLGHGLEIRDYRLFPTEDVMRFIVEIHNTTDAAVDTPILSVTLPHLNGDNFGWANPFARVIHPHSSQGLLGVAPTALSSDDRWGAPNWSLCDDVQTAAAEAMQEWNVEFTYDSFVLASDDEASQLILTNKGASEIGPISIQGLVWDQDGRLCGGSISYTLSRFRAGTSRELWIHIEPDLRYFANPFVLIDSVEQIVTNFSLQVPANGIYQSCHGNMPRYGQD